MTTAVAERARVFYGWYVVGACFAIAFVLYGIGVNTFTVYVKPLEADLGWSRSAISLAITIAALAMGAVAPIVGRLLDRFGARRLMLGGAVVVGGAWAMMSRTDSLWFFYLVFLLVGVGQAAATLIPISMVIANWFTARRGVAMGIVMSGTGLGAMVMVPVSTWLVAEFGWRDAVLWMGGVMLVTAVPLNLLFVYTRPSDLGLHPDGDDGVDPAAALRPVPGLTLAEAARTRTFWMIAAVMFTFGFVGLGIGVHMMAYLGDLGHASSTAGYIVSLISGVTVAGKLAVGVLADRWGVRTALALTMVALLFGVALLLFAQQLPVAVAFAVVYGFAIGSPLVINPAMVSQYLGLAHFGTIFGVLTLMSTFGAALGPTIAGVVYDTTTTYVPAYVGFMAMIVVAAVCGLAARSELENDWRQGSAEAAGSTSGQFNEG